MTTRFIAWTGAGADVEFDTLAEAENYMRSEGFEPTGQSASDAETDGGRIILDGYCDFWTEDGRSLDSYAEGYEPRIRVLHSRGGEEED